MWFAAPVPSDTPFENMTKDPPPGVGPYKITESVPNRQFVLEKVDGFEDHRDPDIPVGNLDKITTEIIKDQAAADAGHDQQRARLHAGSADGGPEAGSDRAVRSGRVRGPAVRGVHDRVHVLLLHEPRRRRRSTTRWSARRSTMGIDKPALARLFAGEMVPGCAFTPPGRDRLQRGVWTRGCPYGDPNAAA